MNDRISDRLLERVRLGEIDEEEVAGLLEELEETEGSTARLDELIEADARFLERHPPEQMAPRIRERLRRTRRAAERQQTGGIMLSARRFLTDHSRAVALAALAIVGVAAVTYAALRQLQEDASPQPPEKTMVVVKSPVEQQDETEAAAARRAPPARRTPPAEKDEAADFFGRFDPPPSDSGELVVAADDEVRVDAAGVSRVMIDSEEIVSVEPDGDDALVLTAHSPGTTPVRFIVGDENHPVFVRVVERQVDREVARGVVRENMSDLARCGAQHPAEAVTWGPSFIELRFLMAPNGKVMSAYAERPARRDLTACVVRAASRWQFPEGEGTRTARVRVNFDDQRPFLDGVDKRLHPPAATEPWPELPESLVGWGDLDEAEREDVVETRTLEAAQAVLRGRWNVALQMCYPIRDVSSRCARIAALAAFRGGYPKKACELSVGIDSVALQQSFGCNRNEGEDGELSDESEPDTGRVASDGASRTSGEDREPKSRLSKSDVKGPLVNAREGVADCAENHNSAGRRGTVKVKFYIRPDGSVRDPSIVSSGFRDTDVGNCVRDMVDDVTFPSTTASEDAPVTYPFILR